MLMYDYIVYCAFDRDGYLTTNIGTILISSKKK